MTHLPSHRPGSPAQPSPLRAPIDRDFPHLLVLGLGNPLMGDDGAGLLLLENLRQSRKWPEHIIFEDGGTLGMTLLPLIEDAAAVLLLDAVHTGAAPGTVVIRQGRQLPGFFKNILSPHQIGLSEVLGAAQLCGTLPAHIALVGIEAENIAFTAAASSTVRNALPAAVRQAQATLHELLAAAGIGGKEAAHA